MILWTIVPEETIFASQNQPDINFKVIDYSGQKIVVEQISYSEFRITRLLTTNPLDYLDNKLQPGKIIRYMPNIETLS
ncbi:YlzJ-like family protein [Sporomusa malonica]|uniref:YlzJ-like protein n=1 Tax=Sporomusa malonica TaxID=112901 RepID=A0A1W2AVP4_9FIRM|nr:YlzJ-like family protein [Sporomusa malonica]SMC64807.1 YlzJ-like protein [Sporomusa malonica]